MFPAIAIANAIREIRPEAMILFVGANGKMEMERVPAAGYEIKGLDVVGLQRKLTLANLAFPFKLFKSLQSAKSIVKEFNPDVAVGVGGYASGPTLRMAEKLGIPTLLQEQNSYPGLTNKLLARKASTICVAYENMDRFFPANKIVLTGNPVRKEVTEIEGKKQEALQFFGLSADKPIVLAIGGSLGARTINESMKASLDLFREAGIQLIWQTGKHYADEIEAFISGKNKEGIWVNAFIHRMDLAYAAADVIISRAGAMSISEICLVGKPTVFVPSPNVTEDHQTKNAMSLVDKQAALLVKDVDAVQKLGSGIVSLIKDKEKCVALGVAAKKLGKPDAAKHIAGEVLKLVEKK